LGRREAKQLRLELQMRCEAESALAEAAHLEREARWAEAQALLDRAAAQLDTEAPADLRLRLDNAQRDLKQAQQLDAMRQKRGTLDAPPSDGRQSPR
jgi:hypothetical protein